MTGILGEARVQVLNGGGAGLDTGQVLRVLRLPGDRLGEALSLAHEVRMRWCGPDVEVEGIVPAQADLDMLRRLRTPIKALSGTL